VCDPDEATGDDDEVGFTSDAGDLFLSERMWVDSDEAVRQHRCRRLVAAREHECGGSDSGDEQYGRGESRELAPVSPWRFTDCERRRF
jgi:hypothetical protein